MREIRLSADETVSALLNLPNKRNVCLLDSCGVSYLDSRFLIAGFDPVEICEIGEPEPEKTLEILDEKLSPGNLAGIFTIAYEFGLKLNRIAARSKEISSFGEPDVFLALFDCLIIHDYQANKTFLTGDENRFDAIEKTLSDSFAPFIFSRPQGARIASNFTRENYISAIKEIQEHIRSGDVYQANLTQQFRARLPENLSPEQIFYNLRKNHPAPFAAFIRRKNDAVVSISPERFFKVQNSKFKVQSAKSAIRNPKSKIQNRIISVSPIKGTRPRGNTELEDLRLKTELLKSEKDRAENVMIVDLLRNDIGRICEYGSITVEKLCDLETHPTLYHLVSTIGGRLRENVNFSDILRAAFPCGSITGAPKISAMRIIDRIETARRSLSMGAIGYSVQSSKFKVQSSYGISNLKSQISNFDLNVAIRTMVVRDGEAVFNVGGGIVIDSVPELEYEETLVKAKALMQAIGAKIDC